ncbi:MAG: hypothetical protein ACT4PV_03845 [Planctomycetaceae bacterium]
MSCGCKETKEQSPRNAHACGCGPKEPAPGPEHPTPARPAPRLARRAIPRSVPEDAGVYSPGPDPVQAPTESRFSFREQIGLDTCGIATLPAAMVPPDGAMDCGGCREAKRPPGSWIACLRSETKGLQTTQLVREPPQGFLPDWERTLLESHHPALTTTETPDAILDGSDAEALEARADREQRPEQEAIIDPEGSDARYRGAFHKLPAGEPPSELGGAEAPSPKGGGGPPGEEFSTLPPCPCDCRCVTPEVPNNVDSLRKSPWPFSPDRIEELPRWWPPRKRPLAILAPEGLASPTRLPETSRGFAPALLPFESGQVPGAGMEGWAGALIVSPAQQADEQGRPPRTRGVHSRSDALLRVPDVDAFEPEEV